MAQLKHKKAGRVKPLGSVLGFVIGAGLGHFIDRVIIDPGADKDLFPHDFTRHGGFIGGTAGLAVGLALSTLVPSLRTIDCF